MIKMSKLTFAAFMAYATLAGVLSTRVYMEVTNPCVECGVKRAAEQTAYINAVTNPVYK